MRFIIKILFLLFFPIVAFGQPYWQQKVDNKIEVTLNDFEKSLTGTIYISYTNNSPDTLSYIWMHLWPNAYKNDRTAFSDQFLENGRTDFYFSDEGKRGYINRLNFTVNGRLATIEDHPQHQDIVKLLLPEKLATGQTTKIVTGFRVQLPAYFSRSGYKDGAFYATQWFPKPAVYDKQGWHSMPYLDQGEFYSEFGSYEVSITANEKFIIAATGNLSSTETNLNNTKTYTYKQNNVHDFAWFADKEFKIITDTIQLPSHIVKAAVYHFGKDSLWKKSMAMLKDAVRTKSQWVGEYPYDEIKVVESRKPDDGMEYPTIVLVDNNGDELNLDYLINHEVGHNWFYGILANNERRYPWMDEGFNTFYDFRYSLLKYNNAISVFAKPSKSFFTKKLPAEETDILLQTLAAIRRDQPISTTSEKFCEINYNQIAYTKTGHWLQLLEKEIGTEQFDKVMQEYYNNYKFKHPQPGDFKAVAERVSGKDLSNIFALLDKKGTLQPTPKKQVKLTGLFNLLNTDKYHYIALSPAIGINKYDKFMLGAAVHNYNLPPSKFKFIAVPLYSTGARAINGIGNISYTHFAGNNGNKIAFSVGGAKFTADDFTDSTGKRNAQPFYKVAPMIKYIFYNKNPRSHVQKSIGLKNYFISETGLNFLLDTINHVTKITYPITKTSIQELNLTYDNNRVLYPHSAMLQLQNSKQFARINFTGNYYFNYSKGGGMQLRFFAGKFFYKKGAEKSFYLDKYKINMSGAKGDEDFTYENYFFGRNEFEGFANRQIMIKDGAFKVRTDMNYNKVGKTDNWLTAINLCSSIPNNINLLNLLPIKIPLKVFADVGTYSGAWKLNSETGKFLYDAGLQISILKNSVNIYMPLLYSKVYKDYFKSVLGKKILMKNIAFSIDVQNITLRKIAPNFNF